VRPTLQTATSEPITYFKSYTGALNNGHCVRTDIEPKLQNRINEGRETMTLRIKLSVTVLAAALAAAFVFSEASSAASKNKKVSYERAWKLCKDQLNKEKIPAQTNDRYLRGGACMKNYGYDF
jgi:hypothetical protein